MEDKKENIHKETFHYVYFIESLDIFGDAKYSISMDSPESNILEKINLTDITNKKSTFSTCIYRFKIFPNKILEEYKSPEKFEVEVVLENDKNKCTKKINNLDIYHDNYLYDFKIDFKNENTDFNFNERLEMNYIEKFNLFINRLKTEINHTQKEKDDLLYSTLYYLINKKEEKEKAGIKKYKYSFSFLVTLIIEFYESIYFPLVLKLLKPEDIDEYGVVPDEKISELAEVLDKIEKKLFTPLEKEDSKEELIINFYRIKLYVNFVFYKEKLNEMFGNEKIKNYLYKILILNEDLFNGLILNKKNILELLNLSGNLDFVCLKNKLKFNNDFLIVLQIINEKINKYKECNKEKNKNIFIDMELIVFPKKEDDLNAIYVQIENLFSFEKNSNAYFVNFSPSLIEKYINIYNKVDLDKLIILSKIIALLKKECKRFILKQNINEVIHFNGIIFANKGKLKNIELLNFIEQDDYYKKKISDYCSVDILSGIDISSINNEFLKKWREINFFQIFYDKKQPFLNKICDLIDINHFNLIFDLLNENSDVKDEEKIFNRDSILKMQEMFDNFFYDYSPENNPNFLNDVINIIYYSDKNNVIIKEFMTNKIQKLLNVDTVNDIYISLAKKYKNLSNDLLNIIINFFTRNPLNKDPSKLSYIIKNSNELRNIILKNMSNFIIDKNDIFQDEDSLNFKLLENLINDKIFIFNEKDDNKLSKDYMSESSSIIKKIISDFQSLDVKYSNLVYIYETDFKSIFYRRLSVICLLNENLENGIKDLLKSYYITIKTTLKNLNNILNYLSFFHKTDSIKTKHREIQELIQLVKNKKVIDFAKEYQNKCSSYITEYKQQAKRGHQLKQSIFYNTIFKQTRVTIDDDNKFLNEVNDKLKQIKLLYGTGIKSTIKDFFNVGNKDSNEKLIEIILRNIKNKNELGKEVDLLAEILDIKKYNKNKIIEYLNILSKREEVLNVCIGMKIIIDKFQVEITEFYSNINKIISNIYKREEIDVIKKSIEKLNLDLLNTDKEKNFYIESIIKLKEQPEAITFLFEHTKDDCRNWMYLPFEADNNGFLTPDDILNLEKCIEYMEKLGKKEEIKKLKDKELILTIINFINNCKDLKEVINKYVNNFWAIKELVEINLDKTETYKKKICNICDMSIFTLSNEKNNFFNGSYGNDKIKINYEDIIELRDHAQLSKIITGEDKEKEIIKKRQKFIELISQIMNLYKVIKEIYDKGYPQKITINIEINNGKSIFKFEKKDYEDYNILIDILETILKELENYQINAYKNKVLIRYIYGSQFNLIYNAIQLKYNEGEVNSIKPFLKYLTNDLINENIIIEGLDFKKTENIYDDLINDCEEYLKKTLEIHNLSLAEIYKKSLIKEKPKEGEYKGLYFYYCNEIEVNLFQIFKYLTNNNPLAQNVLLCSKESSNGEIISFLYRAILCEFNACFIVGGIELLNQEQKAFLIEKLNELFSEKDENMKACLIFLYTSKTTDIYKNFISINNKKILHLKGLEEQKYEGEEVEIIISDKPGVGKSETIKNDIKKESDYKYFPLGGVLTKMEIIERLKELKYDDNSVIHLDLFDTEQTQIMNEFLFSILLTKYYGQNDNFFYLSKKVKIKVEIQNSFIDFFAKFPILNLFKKKIMNIKNIGLLKVKDDIESNEEIIANYIIGKEILKNEDLILSLKKEERKRSKKYKKYKINEMKKIDAKECHKYIIEEIEKINEINNPSYFQIKTFINILGIQIKQLLKNNFLSTLNLLDLTNEECCKSMRKFIIENIFNTTKYFTQGAFDEILKNQIKTQDILFGQYDEGKDILNAINDLSEKKNNGFSFNNLSSPILFFHEENKDEKKESNDIIGNFSIISNKNYEDKGLLQLNKIYKKQYKKDCIINFENYKQNDYLLQLKNILKLKNPVEKSKKCGSHDLISLEEITGDYVLTPDNFTKMILIYMRIKAGIPVIMMGETGCGKTSLIKKLSELINNREKNEMKILNIHAGTTDKDIIEFIEKKVLPASIQLYKKEIYTLQKDSEKKEIKYEKKIWVFLDEINTCKSMGLITELMCKNSYHGNKLPPNIIFIGACNPYRKSKKPDNENIGLDANFAQKEKENNLNDFEREIIRKKSLYSCSKLVYFVNPLPPSLLNYVFNFGNLESEDEKKYIENMVQNNLEKKFATHKSYKELLKLKELIKNMIYESQSFIRDNNDKSSVSLREISRFNNCLNFFVNYLTFKRKNSDTLIQTLELEKEYAFYKSLTDLEIFIYSINLSIYICYYLRITRKDQRDKLVGILNRILTCYEISSKYNDFLYIANLEQEYLIKNINLEKGISKNRALLENLFSLFVTINNRIPIFIVGKPGCSKSLSVQLIYKAMKGKLSTNSLFKCLPRLIISTYQGSMGSTSKGVQSIFEKAKKILKSYQKKNKYKNDIENVISMIFFDEIGLAEKSPNNPLKVIHS